MTRQECRALIVRLTCRASREIADVERIQRQHAAMLTEAVERDAPPAFLESLDRQRLRLLARCDQLEGLVARIENLKSRLSPPPEGKAE